MDQKQGACRCCNAQKAAPPDGIGNEEGDRARDCKGNGYAVRYLHGADIDHGRRNENGNGNPGDKRLQAYAPDIKCKHIKRAGSKLDNRINRADGRPACAAPAAEEQETEYGHQVTGIQTRSAFGTHGRPFCNGQAVWDAVDAYV